ncbi:MAG: CehA/McbA family metallohydrolase [Anaerolineae bacterium]
METYGRADLHMHTNASDGVPTVRELLNHVARHTRLDVIAITDHDRVDASVWAYEHSDAYPFEIIPGTEVTCRIGHVLGLWVTQAIPMNLSLEETVAAIHAQGGVAVLAHPYHIQMTLVARNAPRYTRRPAVLLEAGLDGIEVHNAGIVVPGMNIFSHHLARKLRLAQLGNSDAHTLGGIGSGVTRFPGRTADDLRRAISAVQTHAEGTAWPMIDYWNYSCNLIQNRSKKFSAESLS